MNIFKATLSSTLIFVIFMIICIIIMFAYTRRRAIFPDLFSVEEKKPHVYPKTPVIFLISNAVSCDASLRKPNQIKTINSISNASPTWKPDLLLKKLCILLLDQIKINYHMKYLQNNTKMIDHKMATCSSEFLSQHNMQQWNECAPKLTINV